MSALPPVDPTPALPPPPPFTCLLDPSRLTAACHHLRAPSLHPHPLPPNTHTLLTHHTVYFSRLRAVGPAIRTYIYQDMQDIYTYSGALANLYFWTSIASAAGLWYMRHVLDVRSRQGTRPLPGWLAACLWIRRQEPMSTVAAAEAVVVDTRKHMHRKLRNIVYGMTLLFYLLQYEKYG